MNAKSKTNYRVLVLQIVLPEFLGVYVFVRVLWQTTPGHGRVVRRRICGCLVFSPAKWVHTYDYCNSNARFIIICFIFYSLGVRIHSVGHRFWIILRNHSDQQLAIVRDRRLVDYVPISVPDLFHGRKSEILNGRRSAQGSVGRVSKNILAKHRQPAWVISRKYSLSIRLV